MPEGRPVASPKEREQLRRFVRVVISMDRRRFLQRIRQEDQIIVFDEEIKAPVFDRDDFDAYLTDFRKVAMSDSEPVYLTKVMATTGKLASTELRANLKALRRQVVPLLKGKVTLMEIGYEQEGAKAFMTPERIIDTLVNGEIFHVDPSRTARADSLREMHPAHYLWPAVHFFVLPIHRACVVLFHVLWRDGILEPEDYPPDCRPPGVNKAGPDHPDDAP